MHKLKGTMRVAKDGNGEVDIGLLAHPGRNECVFFLLRHHSKEGFVNHHRRGNLVVSAVELAQKLLAV